MRKIFDLFWKYSLNFTYGLAIITSILLFFNFDLDDLSTLTAQAGTITLCFMLIVKNISKFKPKSKDENIIFTICRYNATRQREQGIIVFNLFLIHSVIAIVDVFNNFTVLYSQIISIVFGLVIFLYLILTSFKGVQKNFKGWKQTHSIVWIVFPLILFHIWYVDQEIDGEYILLSLALIATLIAGLYYSNSKQRTIKQIIFSATSLIFIGLQFLLLTFTNFISATPTNNTVTTNQENSQSSNTDSVVSDTTSTDDSTTDDTTTDDSTTDTTTDDSTTDTTSTDDSTTDTTSTDDTTTDTNQSGLVDGTYSGSGTGYHRGQSTLSVTISGGEIIDITLDSTQDTPGYYEYAFETITNEVIDTQSTDVQTVSGATFSSRGFIEAIDDAISQAQ